jgi:exodeoxyribonuclease-3
MRIVAWNIRAGGGRRAEGIARQLHQWNPDLAILSEFRGTAASQTIATALAEQGLLHQRATCSAENLARNALLVASRWPLRRTRSARDPKEPERWLRVGVFAPQRFDVLAVHAPNRVTHRKYPFLDTIGDVVGSWRGPPAMVIGDTNTGRIGLDEESSAFNAREEQWMLHIDALGWRDAFRMLHPKAREFTWYSPNGNNGFRLDQAFVHPGLADRLRGVAHVWGTDGSSRRDGLSDHAALVLEFY